jgi:hypothetical protein
MDASCHIIRHTAHLPYSRNTDTYCHGYSPSITLSSDIHCHSWYMPSLPLHPPRFVDGLGYLSQSPVICSLLRTPHPGFRSFVLPSVWFVQILHIPLTPTHLPFTVDSWFTSHGFGVLYPLRNCTTTCSPLHRITSMTGLFLTV